MTQTNILYPSQSWTIQRLISLIIISISVVSGNSASAFTFKATPPIARSILVELVAGSSWIPQQPSFIRIQSLQTAAPAWRLVRTPGPEKRGDIVSIMRTGDVLKSDPDFAGIAIRCSESLRLQLAVVLVAPFPPRARPQVVLNDGRADTRFAAAVLPGGSMITLPDEAGVLVQGPWQTAKELSVSVESDGTKIRGIVPLAGLTSALDLLQTNCRMP